MNEPSTEPELNVPLLTKVLDHITAHPKEWNQGLWAVQGETCGTTCCVAGWAAVMSGHTLDFEERSCPCTQCEVEGAKAASYTTEGEFICNVAQRELGLTVSQAGFLFSGTNNLDDLWFLANAYSDGEIERLEVTA